MAKRKLEDLNLLDDFLFGSMVTHPEVGEKFVRESLKTIFGKDFGKLTDYSGPAAHLGRSLAQLDRASAHLIQSAFRHMPIADQPIY